MTLRPLVVAFEEWAAAHPTKERFGHMEMSHRLRPSVGTEVYEQIAVRYAEAIDDNAYNAYLERPATLGLLPEVAKQRVLDAGCGPGKYSDWLVGRGAAVTAIDGSPAMVALAREKLGSRAEVHLANLEHPLSFVPDSSQDIVLAPLVLDYLRVWDGPFREFFRVLRPGGVFVFSVNHPMSALEFSPTKAYFEIEPISPFWERFGVHMPCFRRPLNQILEPLAFAGFRLNRLLEPLPTDECRVKHPNMYDELRRKPSFLCVRADRPMPGLTASCSESR